MRTFIIGIALSLAAVVPMAQAEIVTYDVVMTVYEPQTQPNDTIFTGSFDFDTVSKTVSNLSGTLTESMTGMGGMGGMASMASGMNELTLSHQLSSVYDPTLGGLLVTTFLNNNTNTLYNGFGGDGWSPGTGMGLYYDWPGTNPGNAYAMIFVNTTDPTTPLTQAQIDKLAYADCAPGGMMGATCMTGTTVAGYGVVGTMGGYPVSQTITARTVPNPVPDVKVNGADGPVTLALGDPLAVTISLNPGTYDGNNGDMWMGVLTPFGFYWLTLDSGWVRSFAPVRMYGGPITSLAPTTVLNTSGLPAGSYLLLFGVDDNMDDMFSPGHFDWMRVTIEAGP